MSVKTGLGAILLLAAAPAIAQAPATGSSAPAPTGPEAAIQQTAMAFGQCISAGVQNVPASVTPDAGAANVLNGCSAQRGALANSVDAMIATFPEAQRAQAHAQFESQMGQATAQIAAAISQRRAAPTTHTP